MPGSGSRLGCERIETDARSGHGANGSSLGVLLRQLTTSQGFSQTLDCLKLGDHSPVRVAGLAGSLPSFLVAHLAGVLGRPILVVCPGEEESEAMEGDLLAIFGDEDPEDDPSDRVFRYPDLPSMVYASQAETLEAGALRLAALTALRGLDPDSPPIVVTNATAVCRRTFSPETLSKAVLTVEVNGEAELDDLSNHLSSLGFDRVPTVLAPGTYSVRGGIVDVFPYNYTQPIRIELLGDTVESIRHFDPTSQRSTGKLQSCDIIPKAEVLLTPEIMEEGLEAIDKAAQEVGLSSRALRRRLRHEGLIAGSEILAPFFHPEMLSLAAHLPPSTLTIFIEPWRMRERGARLARDLEEMFDKSIQQGELVPRPEKVYEPFEEAEGQLGSFLQLELSMLGEGGDDAHVSMGGRSAEPFQSNLSLFKSRVSDHLEAGRSVFVICETRGQSERMREILGRPEGLSIETASLSSGFTLAELGLAVLTEAEIFSRRFRRVRLPRFQGDGPIRSAAALKLGDYVVHVNHGIGRYVGMKQIDIEGRKSECLEVAYAGGDKLFVPVQQISQLQRYVGGGDQPPTLTRLGSAAWERVKTRTKKAVQDMAEDLIKTYAIRKSQPGHSFPADTPWQAELESSFPYEETEDQLKAIEEVKRDMESPKPMERLVCGDVGYGKTEIAVRAAFKSIVGGKQAAVLVPTTILAQQHLATFRERLSGFPIRVEALSRFCTQAEQRRILEELSSGRIDVLVGTHRLLQEDVNFQQLGLLIVDEEQRFGVSQKEKMKHLKQVVDVLTLTATPIPRTLHMALMGARDMSLINTPPPNRIPIHTEILQFEDEVIAKAVLREMDRSGQVFFVHNRVETIDSMAAHLHGILPQIRMAIAHGQMSERTLERVMLDFLDRKYDMLVATMIVESGLDIPNVNTMVVNRADTLGLSQLYQLRGRVGRSSEKAYVYLLLPRDRSLTETAEKRLRAIAEFTDLGSGFYIAMRDLEIRGAGNILGGEQHGFMVQVGFEMYCRLLDEAIRELKGEPAEAVSRIEARIDLPLDAYLPEGYVEDVGDRLALYRRLAAQRDEEGVEDFYAELKDRFGEVPTPARTLLAVQKLKLHSEELGVDYVGLKDEKLRVTFAPGHQPSKAQVANLVREVDQRLEFTHVGKFGFVVRDVRSSEEALRLAQKCIACLRGA